MPIRTVLLALAVLVPSLVAGAAVGAPSSTVASVPDGDTLRLTGGQRVRLVQIDAPERGECYYQEARAELLRLTPLGSSIALEADPQLDQVDRYGRLLRYVERGSANVNVELVRRGAAVPYFFDGDRGRYAGQLLAAERAARSARRGLWSACNGDPHRFRSSPAATRTAPARACRPTHRTGTAASCGSSVSISPSASSAPTRTGWTPTATGSAASSG